MSVWLRTFSRRRTQGNPQTASHWKKWMCSFFCKITSSSMDAVYFERLCLYFIYSVWVTHGLRASVGLGARFHPDSNVCDSPYIGTFGLHTMFSNNQYEFLLHYTPPPLCMCPSCGTPLLDAFDPSHYIYTWVRRKPQTSATLIPLWMLILITAGRRHWHFSWSLGNHVYSCAVCVLCVNIVIAGYSA